MLITELARRIKLCHTRVVEDLGPDLEGLSILDLAADNFPNIPLDHLKDAIKIAKISKDKSNDA